MLRAVVLRFPKNKIKFTLVVCLLLFLVFAFYFWRLGSITAGMSQAELLAQQTSSNWHNIYQNPTYAPHKLAQSAFQSLDQRGVIWMRLVSVVFGLLFIFVFYKLAKLWFGRTVGILGTIIFATTPWVVLSSRNMTTEILLLAPLALIASYVWFAGSNGKNKTAWLILALVSAVSLYIPGLVWFLLAVVAIDFKRIRNSLSGLDNLFLALGALLFMCIVAPLVWASINDPAVAKTVALIPLYWNGLGNLASAAFWSVSSLVWRTGQPHDLIIDRLPLLNLIQLAIAAFGVFAMWARARKELYILLAAVGVGLIGYVLNENLALLSLSLPSLALIATAGLRYLYMEWKSVFPHNPLASSLAVFMILALVFLNILIGARYSLAAWPNTQETKTTYVIK